MNIALLKSKCKHCFSRLSENQSMHIGKRIQGLMKLKKISTQTMADYCEVTPGAVSNWFSTGRISKVNMAKAAQLLETDIGELISGDENPVNPTQNTDVVQPKDTAAPSGLSEDALGLAAAFDWLKNHADRVEVKRAAEADIFARVARRAAAQVGMPVDQDEAPTTGTSTPSQSPKKQPARRR